MAATKAILRRATGADLHNSSSDLSNLRTLLNAAGQDAGSGGGAWDDKLSKALEAFRQAVNETIDDPSVDPESDELPAMIKAAQIQIPMPGQQGIEGVKWMHNWFADNGIQYNAGAEEGNGNRANYGLRNHTDSAVQTTSGKFAKGPVEMDCTTYVNLMLGIYLLGNIHQSPYDANCADFGGTSPQHLARDRYGFTAVQVTVGDDTQGYAESADQITSSVQQDVLYALEVAKSNDSVTHMALLYNGTVMECTTGQTDSACIQRSVEDFMRGKSGRRIYLFSPTYCI